jgi:transcriptional regulator with XRE-family HTH domain
MIKSLFFNQEKFKQRLLYLVEQLGKSQKQFCDEVGMHATHFSSIKNRGMVPGLEVVAKICSTYGVNLNWLAFGVGEIFLEHDQIANRVREDVGGYYSNMMGDELFQVFQEVTKYDFNTRIKFAELLKTVLEIKKI